MANELVKLNSNWRVADDPPQWTLERRTGNPSEKGSGWRARKFIRYRDHLLKRIAEMCGEVDPDAIETIKSWPVGYVTWKAMKMKVSASLKTGPQGAISDSEVFGGHSNDNAHHARPGEAA